MLLTYVGVPSIYYGDEVGLRDDPALGSRGCMPWDPGQWDHSVLEMYRRLIGLRRQSAALQRGGFQMLMTEPDAFAYARDGRADTVIVVAHRGKQIRPAGALPVRQAGIGNGVIFVEQFSGARSVVAGGVLPVPALPQGAQVWRTRIAALA